MASSSAAIEAGPTGYRPESVGIARTGIAFDALQSLPDGIRNFVIIPDAISGEQFRGLDGINQETVLISLLKRGNVGKVNELRPDFEMDRPLDYDEKRMADWTSAITSRDVPITAPAHDDQDTLFAQIHHTAYSMPKNDLAAILENERQRKIKFTPGLFAPAQPIERFTAARRYRAMLEVQVAKEEARESTRKKAA